MTQKRKHSPTQYTKNHSPVQCNKTANVLAPPKNDRTEARKCMCANLNGEVATVNIIAKKQIACLLRMATNLSTPMQSVISHCVRRIYYIKHDVPAVLLVYIREKSIGHITASTRCCYSSR